MSERFDDILNECTEHLLRGESVEQCLQRYPEQARELEPLLRVAVAAGRASSAAEPRPEFRARVRQEIRSRLHSPRPKPELKRIPALQWIPRWAAVAACVALVFVFAAGGTVAASSGSLPGDTLYPVKTATEQVRMSLTFSNDAKARLEARFAERRTWELARLAEKGRTGQLEVAAAKFEEHLANIDQLAVQIAAADSEDGAKVSQLREVLNANMSKDLALLDAAEERAPWQSRNAVTVAKFRLMQRYGRSIGTLEDMQNQQPEAGSPGGTQSGETGDSGPGGEMGDGGSTGSGQQGQLASLGFGVQA